MDPYILTGPWIPTFLTGPWIPIFMSARGSLYFLPVRGSLYFDRSMDSYIFYPYLCPPVDPYIFDRSVDSYILTGPWIPTFLTGPWIPIFMSARGSLYSDRSKDPFSSISFWPRKFEKLKNLAKLEFRKNKNLGQIIIFNFNLFGQDF